MDLTCEDIAVRTGLPLRTARYRVALWEARGRPRVRRERSWGGGRKGRMLVSAEDFEALLAGEIPECARAQRHEITE